MLFLNVSNKQQAGKEMKNKVKKLTIDLKFTESAEVTYFTSINAWVTDAAFQDL